MRKPGDLGVTSRESDGPQNPAGCRREMCALGASGSQASQPFQSESLPRGVGGVRLRPTPSLGPAVTSYLLRPTRSGGLPSAQASSPTPVHLMPDTGKGRPALPLPFTYHMGLPGQRPGGWEGKGPPCGPSAWLPWSALCGSDSENTAALWPQNAFHFLRRFLRWSRARSSSEIESVNCIYVYLKTVTPVPSLT